MWVKPVLGTMHQLRKAVCPKISLWQILSALFCQLIFTQHWNMFHKQPSFKKAISLRVYISEGAKGHIPLWINLLIVITLILNLNKYASRCMLLCFIKQIQLFIFYVTVTRKCEGHCLKKVQIFGKVMLVG